MYFATNPPKRCDEIKLDDMVRYSPVKTPVHVIARQRRQCCPTDPRTNGPAMRLRNGALMWVAGYETRSTALR